MEIKLMSLPPALGSICVEPFPCQASMEPAGAPGRMAEQEGSLTTKTGGPTLSQPHFVPTIAPRQSQAWLLSRSKEKTRTRPVELESLRNWWTHKKVGYLGTRDFRAVTGYMVYKGLSRDFPGTP